VIDHTSICFNNPPLADLAINPAPGLCRCEQSAGCRPTDGFDTQLLLLWSKLKNVMQIVVQWFKRASLKYLAGAMFLCPIAADHDK
jgi:hypothetical protein